MTLNKAILLSILKYALTFLGTLFIGKSLPLLGALDTNIAGIIIGSLMTLVGLGWGFFDGSTTLEAWNSGIKSSITGVGGLLVASGKITQDKLDALITLVISIGPVVISQIQKVSNKQVANPNQSNIVIESTSGKIVDLSKPINQKPAA